MSPNEVETSYTGGSHYLLHPWCLTALFICNLNVNKKKSIENNMQPCKVHSSCGSNEGIQSDMFSPWRGLHPG